MLYIISTPIGNLEDLSTRAVRVLKEVDCVFVENRATSITLLATYGISQNTETYNMQTERSASNKAIQLLTQHKKIALICSAGTPLINDPGYVMVREVIQHGLPYTAIPGPCSVINALVLSGHATSAFTFNGFVPKRSGEMISFFATCLHQTKTTVCLISTHKLEEAFKVLCTIDKNHQVAVLKEMTKVYEKTYRGSNAEILERIQLKKLDPRGEFVLVFPKTEKPKIDASPQIQRLAHYLIPEVGINKTATIISKVFDENKKNIYSYLISLDK